jgi:hypothetical protein
MGWAEDVACVVESGQAPRVLVRIHQGTRQLGRPKSRWENNIKFLLLKEFNGGLGLNSSVCG